MEQTMRADAERIITQALWAVQPDGAVERALRHRTFTGRVVLAAAGSLGNFGAGAYGALGQALDLVTSPAALIVLAGVAGFLLFGRKKGGEGK